MKKIMICFVPSVMALKVYYADDGMPDVVFDVWKSGIDDWGYKGTSALSLNDTQYIHR